MKCPNCDAPAPDGATECAGCGVIFAKLKKIYDREREDARAELESGEEASRPAALNPWVVRALAAGFVLLWLLGFAVYYHEAVAEARARSPRGTIPRRIQ